jgi:hypothetical protein
MNSLLFKRAFIALVVVGGMNYLATVLFLYWTVWWMDMLVHTLGGVWVALTVLWLMSLRKEIHFNFKTGVMVLWGVIIVGILWEVFELATGVTSFADGMVYVLDTVSDMIMDIIGGIIGYWIGSLKK